VADYENTWRCIVPGQPRGWRQNHTARGKVVQSYLVDNAKAWQKMAVALMRQQWTGEPLTCGVRVYVEGVFPRPNYFDCDHKRKPCSCPPEMLNGEPRDHLTTPDLTNVFKLAEDALVRARVLGDDKTVCSTGADARYAAAGCDPYVMVTMQWTEPNN